jgi:hypothetical protein
MPPSVVDPESARTMTTARFGVRIYFSTAKFPLRIEAHTPPMVCSDLDKALSDEFIIPSNSDIGAITVPEENGGVPLPSHNLPHC